VPRNVSVSVGLAGEVADVLCIRIAAQKMNKSEQRANRERVIERDKGKHAHCRAVAPAELELPSSVSAALSLVSIAYFLSRISISLASWSWGIASFRACARPFFESMVVAMSKRSSPCILPWRV
jgi:hypothetical protein